MTDLKYENLDDGTTGAALFQKFIEGCGPALFFAAILDDGKTLHSVSAYERPQALFLAHRLRRLAKEIEANYDYGSGPESPVTP